jgi:putative transposase
MDFVHDALFDCRAFRVLRVVDQWSRWSPILEVAQSMSGAACAEALDRAIGRYGKPRSITVDHGTEFTSRALDACLNANQFLSIDDARCKIESWRADYNAHRPHSSLGQLTPNEFMRGSVTEGKKIGFFQQ